MKLRLLSTRLAVCQLPADALLPTWAREDGEFFSFTRTADECSVVCDQKQVPATIKQERDWCALQVVGPLDFSLVGILHALTGPLAAARLSVFVVSTYQTDYLLVKEDTLPAAVSALRHAGHEVAEA